jgi:TP901 family phage tail tape measure protein
MAENVIVQINVQDLGSTKIDQFARNVKTGLAGVGSSVKTTDSVFRNFTSTLAKNTVNAFAVLPAYAAVGAAIGGIGAIVGTAIGDFIAFDKALREASSIAPELTKQFESTRRAIIALDPALGTTEEIARGLFETLSAGISIGKSIEESLKFTADAAKLAKAALTDNETAVKALSTTLSAFGADISDATRFSDAFQKSVVIGQFRFEEMAQVIGRVSPIAATLGVSFEELNAGLATLSQGGLSAAESVTALRSVFSNVIQNAEKFASVGIDVNDVLSEQNGLVKLMTRLREVTGGSETAIREFIPDIRGLVAALALTGPQYEALIKNNEIMADTLGETEKAFKENQKSISASLDRLRASFDRAVQSLGDSGTAQAAVGFIDGLGKAIESTADQASTFSNVTKQISGGIAELGGSFNVIGGAVLQLSGQVTQKLVPSFLEIIPGVERALRPMKDFGRGIELLGKDLEISGEDIKDFADDLKSGGLAAQEALNRVRKANADAANERLKAIRLANSEVDVLKQVANAQILAAKAAVDVANGYKEASTGLQILGLEAAGAGNETQQLQQKLLQVVQGTDQFENRLKGMVGTLIKNKKLTGELAEEVRGTATEYARSIASLAQMGGELRTLGATADQLAGKQNFVVQSLVETGVAAGKTELEVELLVAAYIEQTAHAENLGKQLRENKIDVDKFGTGVGQLRIEMDAAVAPATKLEAAFRGLAGVSFKELETSAAQTIGFVNELIKQGGTSFDFLISKVEESIDSFEKLGQEVPADLKKLEDTLRKTAREAITAEEAFEGINGIKLDAIVNEIKDLQAQMTKLGGSGFLQGTRLAEQVENLATLAKRVFGNDIPAGIKRTIDQQAALARSTTTVKDAFESLNGITLDAMNRQIRQGLREVELLFNAGLIGSEDMKARLQELQAQLDKMPPSSQAALQPLLDSLERGVPLAQGLNDSLQVLGATTLVDMKASADEAGLAFKQAFESGQLTGKELVRVFENEVAPKYEEANQRLPNSLILAYEKAKGIADVESRRLGTQISDVLGTTITEGVERQMIAGVSRVINTIKDRFRTELRDVSKVFDEIAPGTTSPIRNVTFANDLAGLRENEAQIRRQMSQIRGATPAAASSREQLNKALKTIQDRIREIERAEADAERQSQSFNNTATSGLFSTANATQSVVSGFGRITDAANSATSAISRSTSALDSSSFNTNTTITTSTDGGLTTGIAGGQTGGTAAAFSTRTSGGQFFTGRFQAGLQFAQQGQLARLDRGEMIVPRDIAKRLRSLDLRQLASSDPSGAIFGAVMRGANFTPGKRSFVPGTGFVGSIIISRARPTQSLAQAGFQHVPGFGTIPTPQLATAAGNSDQIGGENTQIQQQKNVTRLVRGAITRRDLTREISGSTALTNKGTPQTGGS